jgi:hypothetical protein
MRRLSSVLGAVLQKDRTVSISVVSGSLARHL